MSVEDRIDHAVEKYQESKIKQRNGLSESDDSDAEFLDLLDDNEMARIRDDRMLQLKREFREIDRAASRQGFGTVNFVSDEKAVMEIVTKNKDVLVHFYQPDFPKCTIMNERLNILAEKHLTLQIVAIKAVDAPFLVQKLNVKVLPFVVAYKNGLEVTRIVGFERLADEAGSDFSVASLEALLYQHGVLQRTSKNHKSGRIGVPDAEESDLDLDD